VGLGRDGLHMFASWVGYRRGDCGGIVVLIVQVARLCGVESCTLRVSWVFCNWVMDAFVWCGFTCRNGSNKVCIKLVILPCI
jgi:hypothetical protein